jgi:hypothetical protein
MRPGFSPAPASAAISAIAILSAIANLFGHCDCLRGSLTTIFAIRLLCLPGC